MSWTQPGREGAFEVSRAPARPGWREGVLRALAAERPRWILWCPVGLGLGIGLYFALPFEPRPASLLAPALLLALFLVMSWRRPILLLLALPLLGFLAAAQRSGDVAAPILAERLGPVEVVGRVLQASPGEGRRRLLLDRVEVSRLAAEKTPARLRLSLANEAEPPQPGDRVRVRAMLLPPPAPQMPGAYDFPRQAYFQRLGAVGFAVGPVRAAPQPVALEAGWRDSLGVAVNRLRQQITLRVLEIVPGPAGGIAAALLTGERAAIGEEVNRAMQDAGLAHLLSISGLHLALVAGIVFFAARFLLAAIEPLALRYPIKKWAAAAALLGGLFYMLLSGAAVPTQRAFIMSAIVLTGVMLERGAVTMRLVAWAAIAVLLSQPESLLEISFQMSFAAVIALIAAYENWSGVLARRAEGWIARPLAHLGQVLASTLIASLATAPFALHYFGRFVDYGVLANLVAVPLVGFAVMPLGLLALALMPLGLEEAPLIAMGFGVEIIVATARWVSALPGAVALLPRLPLASLLLIVAGGLWLCLWRGPWRRAGLLPVALALPVALVWPLPDILVASEGGLVGFRGADGGLILSERRARSRVAETWLSALGLAVAEPAPRAGVSRDGSLRCDAAGCIYRAKGHLVALPAGDAALAEDCRLADLVIAPSRHAGRCPGARRVIDIADLRRAGAHAVYLGLDGELRLETVAGWRGRRPWSVPGPAANTGAAGRPAGPGSAPGLD